MIHKPIENIEKQDIEQLVQNKVREGRTIEYKEVLPGPTDGDRKEFLADVSSFANTAGGDLLFGISETTGLPSAVRGLVCTDLDAELLRLENVLRDGIDPRIQGLRISHVPGFPKGPVILVRVPSSWASPHMVKFKNSSRFYGRNSGGKYQMDVTEIRSAFALSEALPERIQRFRDDRLAKIVAGDTPLPLREGAKLVLHILPLASFSQRLHIEPSEMNAKREYLLPLCGLASQIRYNVDGVVSTSGFTDGIPGASDYCQVFRTGVIEAVDADMLGRVDEKIIPSLSFESELIRALGRYLCGLRELKVPESGAVMLTLLGVSGYTLAPPPWVLGRHLPIDRDLLMLPDVFVDNFDCDAAKVFRPIFDAAWNAAGYERSPNYDDEGNRRERR